MANELKTWASAYRSAADKAQQVAYFAGRDTPPDERTAVHEMVLAASVSVKVDLIKAASQLENSASRISEFATELGLLQVAASQAIEAAEREDQGHFGFRMTVPGSAQAQRANDLRAEVASVLKSAAEALVPPRSLFGDSNLDVLLEGAVTGAYESVKGTVESAWDLTGRAIYDPEGAKDSWRQLFAGIGFAGQLLVTDPAKFASVTVGAVLQLDLLEKDPGRWAGALGSSAILLLLPAGGGKRIIDEVRKVRGARAGFDIRPTEELYEAYKLRKISGGGAPLSKEAWERAYIQVRTNYLVGKQYEKDALKKLGITPGAGGWEETQVRQKFPGGAVRIYDAQNTLQKTAYEFKTGEVTWSQIKGQLKLDELNLQRGWSITWKFRDPQSTQILEKLKTLQAEYPGLFHYEVP